MNRNRFSFFIVLKIFLSFLTIHLSLSQQGESICSVTSLPKNVISESVNLLRIALNAGVHKIASPIGDGSQTKICFSFSDIFIKDKMVKTKKAESKQLQRLLKIIFAPALYKTTRSLVE